jgi:hypothetical protein
VAGYQGLIVASTGKNLFKLGDILNPPCWDWPQYRGYTDAEMKVIWDIIKQSPDFWANLMPDPGMSQLNWRWPKIYAAHHDVVFCIDRPGLDPLIQTKYWLHKYGCTYANVTISNQKGQFCADSHVDCYIDDRLRNVLDVVQKSPATRTYLLDRSYNRATETSLGDIGYTRVPSVEAFFQIEGI